jgi:hypothetical protein
MTDIKDAKLTWMRGSQSTNKGGKSVAVGAAVCPNGQLGQLDLEVAGRHGERDVDIVIGDDSAEMGKGSVVCEVSLDGFRGGSRKQYSASNRRGGG